MSELTDPIDRKKLWHDIAENIVHIDPWVFDDLNEIIMKQPTVDSVVHGHWVKSNDYSDEPDYSCSECKCIVERVPDDYGGSRALTTDYCPYCGACMDEDTEREDSQ